MRVHEDGLVVNVIEGDGLSDWSAPDGLKAAQAEAGVGMGWRRVDGAWQAPEAV